MLKIISILLLLGKCYVLDVAADVTLPSNNCYHNVLIVAIGTETLRFYSFKWNGEVIFQSQHQSFSEEFQILIKFENRKMTFSLILLELIVCNCLKPYHIKITTVEKTNLEECFLFSLNNYDYFWFDVEKVHISMQSSWFALSD